jgi:hypothetical protein
MRCLLVIFFIAPIFLIPAGIIVCIWRVFSNLFLPKQVLHEKTLPAANL